MANPPAPTSCRYSLGSEGREMVLTLDCGECPGKGPMASPQCLRAALEALSAEDGADTLILSGHLETQVQSSGMAVLRRLVQLAGELAQLSLRDAPAGRRECARCALRPEVLFGDLRTVLLSDIADLPPALKDRIGKLRAALAPANPACRQCLSDSGEDLDLVTESYEKLVRFVMMQGFQIVV